MANEKWEEWQEHSVSEPIVIAKSGQKIYVCGSNPHELKQDLVVRIEKWKRNSLCSESWNIKLNILVDGETVFDVFPKDYLYDAINSIVSTDTNHADAAELVLRDAKDYAVERFLQIARKIYLDDTDLKYILPNAERAVAAYRLIQIIVSNPGNFSVGCDAIRDEWMVKRNPLETTPEELVEIAKKVVADNAARAEEERKQREQAARNRIKKLKTAKKKDAIYLVKWSGNWADEISVNGYSIMDAEERIEFEEFFGFGNEDEDLHINFGTNEDMDCTRGDYLADCEFIEITKADRKTLEKCITLDEEWAPNTVWSDNSCFSD